MTTSDEKRRFNRIQFDRDAIISVDELRLSCSVQDLSLHGALIKLEAPLKLEPGCSMQLQIPLGNESEPQQSLLMQLKLVANRHPLLHCECTSIDLDSMTHLRRIVELNCGDAALLERELSALWAAP